MSIRKPGEAKAIQTLVYADCQLPSLWLLHMPGQNGLRGYVQMESTFPTLTATDVRLTSINCLYEFASIIDMKLAGSEETEWVEEDRIL
jgi:hypothetical protein